jgi:hypothetical protein
MEADMQDEVRGRLQPWRQLFSLRELAAQIGVPSAVLQKFLAGRPVFPSTLRKMLDWLDAEEGDKAPEMDRLLRQLLGDVDADAFAAVRRDVWSTVQRGLKRIGRPVPSWMTRITRQSQSALKQGSQSSNNPDDPNRRF